ncbi:hypothetical protein [Sediminibacterium soli]|uniref:hypothetical protein n=1 Tax=Sediminibacterium soli TaxID=2698829 RepID=UPI00137B22B0|nr:hypothetical protein [Sediminibacterium soli]NCI47151.1 hypothetical protein [Sediminibacterium soli]
MPIEFIKIAYCISAPVFLVYSLLPGARWRGIAVNLVAVSNLLLIGNTVFLGRQLYGLYELARVVHIEPSPAVEPDYWQSLRLWLILLLPLLSLVAGIRRNRWFSLLLLVLFYSFYTPYTWNFFDSLSKAIVYACLFCGVYALLWLCNQLPCQSPNH